MPVEKNKDVFSNISKVSIITSPMFEEAISEMTMTLPLRDITMPIGKFSKS